MSLFIKTLNNLFIEGKISSALHTFCIDNINNPKLIGDILKSSLEIEFVLELDWLYAHLPQNLKEVETMLN